MNTFYGQFYVTCGFREIGYGTIKEEGNNPLHAKVRMEKKLRDLDLNFPGHDPCPFSDQHSRKLDIVRFSPDAIWERKSPYLGEF